MYRETAKLPFGYTVERRTLEDGGGWVLRGGVVRSVSIKDTTGRPHYRLPSGYRTVISWTGDLPVEELESIARFDHHARNALTDEERRINNRNLVLAIGGDKARLGLPPLEDEDGVLDKVAKAIHKERHVHKIMWRETSTV